MLVAWRREQRRRNRRYCDDTDDHAERGEGRDLVDVMEEHLRADEGEDHSESGLEEAKTDDGPADEEIKRAQAEDGGNVGREDKIRIASHGEDRRHRVDGKDDVSNVENDEYEEQGRRQ